MSAIDAHWMQLALAQARLAAEAGEVPVGAVLVRDGALLAAGFNRPIGGCDPTAYGQCRGRAVLRFVTLDGLVERSSVPLRGPGLARFAFSPDGRELLGTGAGALLQLRAPG